MVTAFLPCTVHAPKRRQQPAFGSTAERKRAPVQRRREACIAHVSDVTAGSGMSSGKSDKLELETLAREILNKENEIKNAFQPGRPMPKVGALNVRQVQEKLTVVCNLLS